MEEVLHEDLPPMESYGAAYVGDRVAEESSLSFSHGSQSLDVPLPLPLPQPQPQSQPQPMQQYSAAQLKQAAEMLQVTYIETAFAEGQAPSIRDDMLLDAVDKAMATDPATWRDQELGTAVRVLIMHARLSMKRKPEEAPPEPKVKKQRVEVAKPKRLRGPNAGKGRGYGQKGKPKNKKIRSCKKHADAHRECLHDETCGE